MRAKLDKLTGNLRESDLPSGVDLPAMQQQAHRHDNKSVLDKFSESDGQLLFDGSAVGGGEGDGSGDVDLSNYYTKAETDELLAMKPDSSDIPDAYTKTEIDALLAEKPDASDIPDAYTKAETDALLAEKPDASDIPDAYTRSEIDAMFGTFETAAVGSITLFAGSSIPTGYLLCDGSALSREVYAELFSAIGTAWGEGDGSTTFNLPDLTDKTVWGGDADSIGGYKEAGLPNITGQLRALHLQSATDTTISGAFSFNGFGGNYMQYASEGSREAAVNFNAAWSNGIYGKTTTVQPPAAVMQFCIKYM